MFGASCNTKTDVSVLSGCYEDSVTKHTKIQNSAPCPALSDLSVQSIKTGGSGGEASSKNPCWTHVSTGLQTKWMISFPPTADFAQPLKGCGDGQ